MAQTKREFLIFSKNGKSPIDELYELLMLTETEYENWKEILKTYNLGYLHK